MSDLRGGCTGILAFECWISNRCRPVVDFLLPVVILPICVVLALLFAVHMFVKRRSIKVCLCLCVSVFGCVYIFMCVCVCVCIHTQVDAYEELIRLRTIELRERLQVYLSFSHVCVFINIICI